MGTAEVDLYVQYPPAFSDEALDEFLNATRHPEVGMRIERPNPAPQAGVEWLLPTAAFVFISKSYFDGFLKEAGKDHYDLLKKGAGKLWAYLCTLPWRVIYSGAEKAADDTYSRAFC